MDEVNVRKGMLNKLILLLDKNAAKMGKNFNKTNDKLYMRFNRPAVDVYFKYNI